MLGTHTREAYEALVNELKALKEEVKRLRDARPTSEVESQPETSKASGKSWAEIYKHSLIRVLKNHILN